MRSRSYLVAAALGTLGTLLLTPSIARADKAEKAATKEERTSLLSQCNAKFAGRRKPSGGYSYFDFMQNRHFDIAGPNPTPEEQKKIDEHYTDFLDRERRNSIAAAFSAKQHQQQHQKQQLQQASLKSESDKPPTTTAMRVSTKMPTPLMRFPPPDFFGGGRGASAAASAMGNS